MHALHLTKWHPIIDDVSGTFVLEQCAAIRASGTQVGLVFARIEGLRSLKWGRLARGLPSFVSFDRPVPTLGFKTWNIPMLPVRARVVLGDAALRNRFEAYVRQQGMPDVLHAHTALEAGEATRSIAASNGRPYVVTEHSSEILIGVADARRRAAAQAVYRDAHRVLAVSEQLAARIRQLCPAANIAVVPNLVRDFVFRMRRQLPGDRERLQIVSIGGLVAGKRTQDIISALSGLPTVLRDRIDYAIVGDGPERASLALAAAKSGLQVRFLGSLRHRQAMEVLADADLLVHASGFETFGIVIAEAMALGIPVVATSAGGPDGLVTRETGCLVNVGAVDAMTASIAAILNAIDEWSARRESISTVAFGRFHETVVAKAIVEAYT